MRSSMTGMRCRHATRSAGRALAPAARFVRALSVWMMQGLGLLRAMRVALSHASAACLAMPDTKRNAKSAQWLGGCVLNKDQLGKTLGELCHEPGRPQVTVARVRRCTASGLPSEEVAPGQWLLEVVARAAEGAHPAAARAIGGFMVQGPRAGSGCELL